MADPAVIALFGAVGAGLLGVIGWFIKEEGLPLRVVATVLGIFAMIGAVTYISIELIADYETWLMFMALFTMLIIISYAAWLIRRGP